MKMNFKNLKLAAFITATAAFMAGAPVSAAEFTTSDSVLTLQTPGDDWKQVSDNETWATLTNGDDQITLQHYSNGEKLPELLIAGDDYAQVCQNIISTGNEVFIITGSVVDEADFEAVKESVQSAVINKYDTKTAVQPIAGKEQAKGTDGAAQVKETSKAESSPESAQGTVESAGFTVWVTGQQLNVRAEASTSAAILGTVYAMDALEVTGIEKSGGAETGWYQVSYNGTVGYVASEYTSTVPSTAETSEYTLTDEQVTLYTEDGKSAAYVSRATNGNWYDGSGRQYQPEESGQWTCLTNGSTWEPSTAEAQGYTLTDEQVILYTEDGESAAYIYKATNGSWYDGSGRQYQSDGSGQWTCLTSGSVWTETAPQTPSEDPVSQVEVTDEEGYNSQTLYLGEAGVWQNIAGGIYTDGGNGTWIGSDGTVWHKK